jgi:hypothetical protein
LKFVFGSKRFRLFHGEKLFEDPCGPIKGIKVLQLFTSVEIGPPGMDSAVDETLSSWLCTGDVEVRGVQESGTRMGPFSRQETRGGATTTYTIVRRWYQESQ